MKNGIILKILKDIRPEVDYSASDDFIKDGLLDSFDIVYLVSSLDEEYSISIDGTEILPENFKNLYAISKLLEKYRGNCEL